eukprot:TRINITY_DN4248_c0_g1_i2.p1 TRINITY_DN4248_c0_g1~~TRINITY_DN4248_c0_g1_i2.p1  ORF type:complete len:225 (-),score=48.65 TRINITY_DN4248_c0_g1_i2:502-1107(-)
MCIRDSSSTSPGDRDQGDNDKNEEVAIDDDMDETHIEEDEDEQPSDKKPKPSIKSPAPKKKFDYLYGINPVMTALYANRRKLIELYISDSSSRTEGRNVRIQNIYNQANKLKISTKSYPKDKLSRFCQHEPHQGVILKCNPLPFIRISKVDHFILRRAKLLGISGSCSIKSQTPKILVPQSGVPSSSEQMGSLLMKTNAVL